MARHVPGFTSRCRNTLGFMKLAGEKRPQFTTMFEMVHRWSVHLLVICTPKLGISSPGPARHGCRSPASSGTHPTCDALLPCLSLQPGSSSCNQADENPATVAYCFPPRSVLIHVAKATISQEKHIRESCLPFRKCKCNGRCLQSSVWMMTATCTNQRSATYVEHYRKSTLTRGFGSKCKSCWFS